MLSIKKYSLLALLIALLTIAKAQDVVHKTDGSTDTGRVMLVMKDRVQFKPRQFTLPRIQLIDRREIRYITYADGYTDTFEGYKLKMQMPLKAYKNAVALNILNLPLGNLHLAYERRVQPWLGLRLSANKMIGHNRLSGELPLYERRFIAGFDLNFYLQNNERDHNWYFGPLFRTGIVADATNYYNSQLPRKDYEARFRYVSALFGVGYSYNEINKRVYFNMQGALGRARLQLANTLPPNHYYTPKLEKMEFMAAFYIGYRF